MKSPMYHITLSEEIKRLCPAFQGVAVMAQVTNSAHLSLIHISEPTRQAEISYAVFCLKKKKKK